MPAVHPLDRSQISVVAHLHHPQHFWTSSMNISSASNSAGSSSLATRNGGLKQPPSTNAAMDSQPFRNHGGNGVPPSDQAHSPWYQENGRWYGTYKKGQYMFPIDETECERLDVFHKIFLVARRNALHSSHIQLPSNPRVLDLGCGTGIWGIDMADKYPGGIHVGLDLNYIQPEFIPANMRFLQRDVEDKWQDLEPGSWDLIHLRTLKGSIADWPKLYGEIYRHLKPYYGHIEQVEIDWNPRCDDGTLAKDGPIVRWANELFDAMDRCGRPIRFNSNVTKQQLAAAGFDEIKEEVIKLPLNGWPSNPHERDVGRWFNLGMRQAYQPLSLAALCRVHRRTAAEVYQITENAKNEVFPNSTRAYCTLHIFTARRPR
ncbi:hypothetical protein VTI74DRAFT_2653 [Chaetomium olivicolor]